ncbi:hypothetical protein CEE37_04645 [candidate division LCP-89 bacterium B3_LCP]|uniref:Mannosyl-3-phosphoglycerate phosphatase n=1 Tax=candidate division LCP-89 bacterium B3_LCP TaxID=2012998 RepID=A0A532V3R7_UNCL8|nr:MAG: hypothetical protein CEE37_04645 [candidate division LCP-89 bacterium B3_LCP]
MVTDNRQFIVFSGLYGSMFNPEAPDIDDLLSTIERLQGEKIPLIITSDRTADEVFSTVQRMSLKGPLIVESGGAIYIPEDEFSVEFNYQDTVENYKIIEFGVKHEFILEKLADLRTHNGFKVLGLSEMSPDQISDMGLLSLDEIRAAQARRFSEPILFEGDADEMHRFHAELEHMNLRCISRGNYHIITGDHDEGSAVRFLVQLYREEFPQMQIITIGLGDNFIDAPMLHAVDQPVLLRKPDGKFDSEVGKRGLRFTKNPGHLGWSQAVNAIIDDTEN